MLDPNGVKGEARALLPLLKTCSVDSIRRLIRISSAERQEIARYWPTRLKSVLKFRSECLQAFNELLADMNMNDTEPWEGAADDEQEADDETTLVALGQ